MCIPVLHERLDHRNGVVLQVIEYSHFSDAEVLIRTLMDCLLEVGIKSQHLYMLQRKRREHFLA